MPVNAPKPDRLRETLLGNVPDRIPFFELQVSARQIRSVLADDSAPGSESLDAKRYAEFALRAGIDGLYHSYIWPVGRVYRQDSDGVSHYIDGSIKSRADFGQIAAPDRSELLRRLDELCAAAEPNGLEVVCGLSPPYKLAKAAVGYQDFLAMTLDDPDFLDELQSRMEEHQVRTLEMIMDYPLAGVVVAGDLCFKSGPMIGPETIDRLWLPSTRDFIARIHGKHLPAILHMDGDFSMVMDQVLATQPDAIHPFEVCGELDIYRAKGEIGGRVTLMGNIDLAGVLTFGSPEAVREEVRTHIERLGPGGRYICGSSHEVSESVPPENFMAMAEAIHEFG